MAGQICFASFGVLLSGQPIKIAIQSGFSLAQIGEFAFIIAGLGLSLNVTDQYLYPIVVAVSVITTFFTPYMIRLAEPAYKWAERIIPENWKQFLERYSSGSNTIRQKSAWNKLLKALVHISVLIRRLPSTYLLWLQIVTSVHLQTFARHPRKSNLLDLNPSSDLPDVAGDHDEKESFRGVPAIMER